MPKDERLRDRKIVSLTSRFSMPGCPDLDNLILSDNNQGQHIKTGSNNREVWAHCEGIDYALCVICPLRVFNRVSFKIPQRQEPKF